MFVEMVGLKEDINSLDFEKITNRIQDMRERLPTFKSSVTKLTVAQAEQEKEEER